MTAIFQAAIIYGAETWAKTKMEEILDVNELRMLRWKDMVNNEYIIMKTSQNG